MRRTPSLAAGGGVLPGENRMLKLYAARTICRGGWLLVGTGMRVEVPAVTIQGSNRLSDALFVWSRFRELHLECAGGAVGAE